VDDAQLNELRTWADALVADGEAERRAVGRALLLLIDEVEGLQFRLSRVVEAETRDYLPEFESEPEELPAAPAIDDTAPIRLRDRIRAAAHLNHED
jgi:hypothetical protein